MSTPALTINQMAESAHANSRAKGWWDGIADPLTTVPEKIALIHSEASEALEDWRDGRLALDFDEGDAGRRGLCLAPKPVGFPSELADIVIRVGDLAAALGIDLEEAVRTKMTYNAQRAHRHGGKRA